MTENEKATRKKVRLMVNSINDLENLLNNFYICEDISLIRDFNRPHKDARLYSYCLKFIASQVGDAADKQVGSL